MKDFLIQLVNASFQGGVIIAVVFALRLILKKAPKSAVCLLWLLAIIRLLLPFQLESSLSLQPDYEIVTKNQYQQVEVFGQVLDEAEPVVPMETIKPVDTQQSPTPITPTVPPVEEPAFSIDWVSLLPWLWLSVAAGLLGWSLLSYLKLHRKTKNAIILSDGVWVSPDLDTAFVLGFLKPQIYLPAKLTAEEQKLVIAHERIHIARLDHWYKLFSFITLCIHWFNPLVWLSYVLLCRDIEMACDEQVVKRMDAAQRKAYSAALLGCSAGSRSIAAYPVAFAEVSVKERIVSVLNYKKPGFWITLVSIVAVVFVAVCFLTSPMDDATRMTNMCREAVEDLQNTDSYYLTEKKYISGEPGEDFIGLSYETAESLRSGNDWLRVTVSPDFTYCYLQKDGEQYIKYISDAVAPEDNSYSEWTAIDLSQIQTFRLSWLEELDWDSHEIVYMDHGTNPLDTFFVSFTVDEDPLDENLALTSLEFHFDDDFQLVSVSKTTTSTLGVTTSEVTVKAINDSGIANSIDACFQPHIDLEQELEAVCQLYNDRKSETMDLWRKKCINLIKQLRSSEYQHILCTYYNSTDGRTTMIEQIEMPGFHFFEQNIPNMDTPLGYYQKAAIMAMDGDECYTQTVLNPGDGAWVLTPYDETPATGWMPKYLYEELSAFGTYPLEVCEFETGIRCVFTNQKTANGNWTMEFRFDSKGKLTSIVETFTNFEGNALVSDYDILWETDAQIQQLADDLLEEARKHAACQQQVDDFKQELEDIQEEAETQQTEP